jgi:hypothetical protein
MLPVLLRISYRATFWTNEVVGEVTTKAFARFFSLDSYILTPNDVRSVCFLIGKLKKNS